MDKAKEQELIDSCREGDADAFGLLYDAYAREIYKFVFYKTSHRETAEDIVSQVFTNAWKNLSGYRGDGFRAWLYGIARNAIMDHYRQLRPSDDIDDHQDLAAPSDPAAELDQKLAQAKAGELLSALTAEERDILIMRFWQEMEFREIASVLGKKEGAVKMKAYRALSSLRNRLVTPLVFLLFKIFG